MSYYNILFSIFGPVPWQCQKSPAVFLGVFQQLVFSQPKPQLDFAAHGFGFRPPPGERRSVAALPRAAERPAIRWGGWKMMEDDVTLWWTNILPWKIHPFLMGKSAISTGPCSIAMLVHQRVTQYFNHGWKMIWKKYVHNICPLFFLCAIFVRLDR